MSAGGEAYTAQELCDRQVQWSPFGALDPVCAWLPCWKTVLEDGSVL